MLNLFPLKNTKKTHHKTGGIGSITLEGKTFRLLPTQRILPCGGGLWTVHMRTCCFINQTKFAKNFNKKNITAGVSWWKINNNLQKIKTIKRIISIYHFFTKRVIVINVIVHTCVNHCLLLYKTTLFNSDCC